MLSNQIKTEFLFKALLTILVVVLVTFRLDVAVKQWTQEQIQLKISEILYPNPEELQDETRVTNLNQLMPKFDALIQVNSGLIAPGKEVIEPFRIYYKKIVEYYPKISEGYVLFGNLEYLSGREDTAIAAFKKAAELNPHLFYPYYNLGIIFARRGDFVLAAQAFSQALKAKPEITLSVMAKSLLYQQIGFGRADFNAAVAFDLQRAYINCRTGLQLCEVAIKNPRLSGEIRKNIPLQPKIF